MRAEEKRRATIAILPGPIAIAATLCFLLVWGGMIPRTLFWSLIGVGSLLVLSSIYAVVSLFD